MKQQSVVICKNELLFILIFSLFRLFVYRSFFFLIYYSIRDHEWANGTDSRVVILPKLIKCTVVRERTLDTHMADTVQHIHTDDTLIATGHIHQYIIIFIMDDDRLTSISLFNFSNY